MKITLKPTLKQHLSYEALKDDSIKYVLLGGGAGGGKSWFGCEWLLQMCLLYPGTKWFIGRQELTRLMASSYVTFMKVCSWHKIPEGTWKLNGKYNYIDFANGSRIDLLDVQMKPSDPMYERFGSLEYTGGWLEEAGEIHADAYDVLKSRIGRHMNKDFNIKSKLLLTCNPKKNFLYTQFYKPWKEKTLPKNCAFIQSLYMDNPFTADEYGENLAEMKSQSKKERLMKGNWEYDDDPNKIMDYDAIIDMWTNNIEKGKDKYIVVDAAGEGKDKATLYLWEGWVVTKTKQIDQCNSNELEEAMKDFCNDNQVPRSQMIVDKTGLGWAIPGHLACKGFISQNSAIQPKEYIMDPKRNADKKANYANLRSQCSFLFAEKVNNHEVSILPTDHKETIIEECEVIKEINDDSEKPLRVIGKDEIKEAIGRSPDHFDNLMMRMWFELNKKPEKKQTSTKAAANFYGF